MPFREDPRRGARADRRAARASGARARAAPGRRGARPAARERCLPLRLRTRSTGPPPTRCPAVLGHEGAGVVEAIGPGVTRVRPGDHVALSWAPACGTCAECLRDLPQLCSAAWPAMGTGGLLDGTTRLSRDGEPVYHYSFLSTFAEATRRPRALVRADPAQMSPSTSPGSSAARSTTGVGAVWRTAGVSPRRPGRGLRLRRRRAQRRCSARSPPGRGTVVAVDVEPHKLERRARARRGRVRGLDRGGRGDGGAVVEVSRRRSRRRDRGDRATRGDARRLPLDPAARSGRPDRDPPRGRDAHAPGALDPAPASAACSARSTARPGPSATSRSILGLYRRGRLPLDRLISHRLPLEEVGRAFELMRSGTRSASCST